MPPAQHHHDEQGAENWWQPDDQQAAEAADTSNNPLTTKQATAGEAAHQQRSRESPYERWQREHQEREAAAANQDWWEPTNQHSQAAAEWGQQQRTSNTEGDAAREQAGQPATAAAEPSWQWEAQPWAGYHTTASDPHWSQSWQPAEWQYEGGGTHQAEAATQPHAAHHNNSAAPQADHWHAEQWQSDTGAPQPQQSWNTSQPQPSSSSHQPTRGGNPRPLNTDPLWDGRTLRLSARPRGDNNPGPPPWVHQVRDGRQIGRQGGPTTQQAPTPGPPPLQQPEHTDLMQRHSSITAAQQALQAANRRGETQAMAMQQQVQLIHDIAEHVGENQEQQL